MSLPQDFTPATMEGCEFERRQRKLTVVLLTMILIELLVGAAVLILMR